MSLFNDAKNKLASRLPTLPKLPPAPRPKVPAIATKAVDVAKDVFSAARSDAGKAVGTAVGTAARGAAVGADLAQRLAEQNATAGKAFHAAKQHVVGAAHAADPKSNIEQLGSRDSYKIAAGASASVEGGKGTAGVSVVVSRGPDGKFTVASTGDAAGGLSAAVGAPAGAKGDGSVMAGGAGKLEYRFDTAAQAQRASQICLKQGYGVTEGERDFLQQHLSAVELRGSAAAQVAAKLGVGDALAANEQEGVKGEVALRVELSHPPALVMRTDFSGSVSAGVGLSASDGAKPSTGASLPFGAARLDSKVSIEERFPLPDNLHAETLAAHPAAALSALAAEGLRLPQKGAVKVTQTLDASGGALGSAAGVQSTLSLTTTRERLVSSGALDTLVHRHDPGAALRALGDAADVSASARSYHTYGVAIAPGASVMGYGAGASLEVSRQDLADRPLWSYPPPGHVATALEAGKAIDAALSGSGSPPPPPRVSAKIRG